MLLPPLIFFLFSSGLL